MIETSKVTNQLTPIMVDSMPDDITGGSIIMHDYLIDIKTLATNKDRFSKYSIVLYMGKEDNSELFRARAVKALGKNETWVSPFAN